MKDCWSALPAAQGGDCLTHSCQAAPVNHSEFLPETPLAQGA